MSCGCCGLACAGRGAGGRNLHYLCNGEGHGARSHRTTRCPARHIPAGQLDELVWRDLRALPGEPEPLATAIAPAHGGAWLRQGLQARRGIPRRRQAHPAQQLERLTDAYLRGVIPLDEHERRRRDLGQRGLALAGRGELPHPCAERQQQLAGVAAPLEGFRARVQRGLAAAISEQRRQLVLPLIDRAIVTDAEVEIRHALPTSPESEHVRSCHLRKDHFDHPSARRHAGDVLGLPIRPVAPELPVGIGRDLEPAAVRLPTDAGGRGAGRAPPGWSRPTAETGS